MKKLFSLLLALTLLCAAAIPALAEETDRAAALREAFLAKADEVVVTDNSVIFPDAASETPLVRHPAAGKRHLSAISGPKLNSADPSSSHQDSRQRKTAAAEEFSVKGMLPFF